MKDQDSFSLHRNGLANALRSGGIIDLAMPVMNAVEDKAIQAAPVSVAHNGVVVTTLRTGIDNRALARFTRTPKTGGAPGEFNDPREAAMNWPRNKGIDGSAGRDDWFLKSGAQSLDLAGSDFIVIDSFNRGEFGTGIGRQMNIPVGGVESDKESSTVPDGGAAIIPGLPRYLPPNYYLDATRSVVRWAKPQDKQRYIESVTCPVMTSGTQAVPEYGAPGNDIFIGYQAFIGPPYNYPPTDFHKVTVRGKGFMPHPDDTIKVFVNDLMDDYDAPLDDNKQTVVNAVDNNLAEDDAPRTLIEVSYKSDSEIRFRIRVPKDDQNCDKPGQYSIQIRNTNPTYNQCFSLFAPSVITILPDPVN